MDPPTTVAITGASGLVGRAVVARLEAAGCRVIRFVRRTPTGDGEAFWNPVEEKIDGAALSGVEMVVHLAGENIAGGFWTEKQKKRIVDSRVVGTRLLCGAIAAADNGPRVLCSASAIGFYGDRDAETVDEDSPAGSGFLAETCVAWESATQAAEEAGARVAHLRIGLVLAKEGGLLGKLAPVFKLGLGSVLGDGRQGMSWVALPDLVRMIDAIRQNEELRGPINAVAPGPVSNREFTKTLGRVLNRPTLLPAPAFALRLAAGELADEMLLGGAYVQPRRLLESGFEFEHPALEPALRQILGRPAS